MAVRSRALCVVVAVIVAGCATSPTGAAPSTTCADWRSMSETAQSELVTTIVDANDLLEAVRAGQHEGPAVTRAALMKDAVGSVSKNCELSGQPVQLVADLIVQLYGPGRPPDGYFGASGAPTPERESSPATP